MLGLGDLEFLLNDSFLEEIVINSSSEPVRVYHKKYGWLETNITVVSEAQILNFANIIARRVGRQITTLSPLLDAHLVTGDRGNAVLYPISHKGNTITIRKFARDPWTVIDFINNGTCNAEMFALLWLAIQYEMNVLVSGGTGSGKTSFLNLLMPFIPPNHRIISIEDSVLGESSVIIKKDGNIVRSTVGEVIDKEILESGYVLSDGTEVAENNGNIEVFSMDKKGKIELKRPSAFIRHMVNKGMFKVTLSSGRSIKITKDHSLFTLSDNHIAPIRGSNLVVGDLIATPRLIKYVGADHTFDLTKHLAAFDDCMLVGEPIRQLISNFEKKTIKLVDYYKKNCCLPVNLFRKFAFNLSEEDKRKIKLFPKRGRLVRNAGIPLLIDFDADLACLVGMWLADGCYDKGSIIFSLVNEECNDFVRNYAKQFNIEPKLHSDKVSLMVNSKVLKIFFQRCIGLDGDAYTKKLPGFAYNLRDDLIASLIKGYFSGDGTVKKYEVCCSSASLELLKDIQTLLLRFGVLLRIGKLKRDKTYEASISDVKFLNLFKDNIGFVHKKKKEKINFICIRSGKERNDVIPLNKPSYLKLKHLAGKKFKDKYSYVSWKSWQGNYINGSHIGRGNLQQICYMIEKANDVEKLSEIGPISELAFSDLIWDQVVDIEGFNHEGYVYDFSVPGNESFICENIAAHNTRELQLPKFLYWAPLTVRPPNPEGKGAVEMLDLLVNSLRMRPDRIILGEMRKQDQAQVLFEAMHTGHSVYATVHADSISETITRLINPPINVPPNLLTAVNLNVVMFRDRRKGIRRIYQIGEYIASEGGVKPNILYRWRPNDDTVVPHATSLRFFDDLSRQTGMTQQEIAQDLAEKERILNWMVKKGIRDINAVGEVFLKYYTDPGSILKNEN